MCCAGQMRHVAANDLHATMQSTSASQQAIATVLSHTWQTNIQFYSRASMSRTEAANIVGPTIGALLGDRVGGRSTTSNCRPCVFYACNPQNCACVCHSAERDTIALEGVDERQPLLHDDELGVDDGEESESCFFDDAETLLLGDDDNNVDPKQQHDDCDQQLMIGGINLRASVQDATTNLQQQQAIQPPHSVVIELLDDTTSATGSSSSSSADSDDEAIVTIKKVPLKKMVAGSSVTRKNNSTAASTVRPLVTSPYTMIPIQEEEGSLLLSQLPIRPKSTIVKEFVCSICESEIGNKAGMVSHGFSKHGIQYNSNQMRTLMMRSRPQWSTKWA